MPDSRFSQMFAQALCPCGLSRAAGLVLALHVGLMPSTTLGQESSALADQAGAASSPTSNWTAIIDGKETPAPAISMGDEATVLRLLELGTTDNRVMDHLRHLSFEIGPRLTGSTRLEQAETWIQSLYTQWGLSNVRCEPWGEIATRFDRGPSSGRALLRRETKQDDGTIKVEFEPLRDFTISALSWSAGTGGPRQGPLFKEPITEEEFAAVKDKLRGAWILLKAPAPIGQRGIRGMLSDRFKMRELAREKVAKGEDAMSLSIPERLAFMGVAGYVSTSSDERVWTGAAPDWRTRTVDQIPDEAHALIRRSDYDYVNSRLFDSEPFEVMFDLQHTLVAGPIAICNVIAEIRGSEKPDEVVIVSGHLDSWDGPGSQGTTDNGTGTAVTIEAARLLIAANAKPLRTIRFIHWTGEEQGLLGSKAYVDKLKEAGQLDLISVMFNDDGGTNSQGGLAAADQMVEFLAAATAPITGRFLDTKDNKPLNVNVRAVGPRQKPGAGSDHASFVAAGVPAFFWDEVGRADYGYGWHTQHDRFDLAIEEYLKQSATNSAIAAYRLASAPALLPRSEPEPPAEPSADAKPEGQPATPAATTTPPPTTPPSGS